MFKFGLYDYLRQVGNNGYTELMSVDANFGNLPDGKEREAEFRKELSQIVAAFNIILLVNSYKAVSYRRSWFKRGFLGAFFTIARKWDRLENFVNSYGNDASRWPNGVEGVEDTVLDLAVYCVKLLGVLREVDPERYEALMRRVSSEAESYAPVVGFGFPQQCASAEEG